VSSGTLTVGGQTLSTVEIAQRRAAAEHFIEQSGSGTAVRALGELRRSPDRWFERLRALATSNTTLKVALGVFMGVIAAEAALSVIRSGALDRLIAEIDAVLAEPVGPAAPVDAASARPVPDEGLISLFDTPMASATPPSPADQLDDDPDFDLGSAIDDLLS
jgi:hypothetical protein